MSLERFDGSKEIKEHVGRSVVKSIGEYLDRDADTTVSEAQQEAYARVVEALPEGGLKNLAEKLKGLQGVSSKFNEIMLGVQDTAWRIAKPIITLKSPLVGVVPDKPLSKIAIKTSKIGGDVGVNIIKGVLNQKEKIIFKVKKLKNKD